jgi:RNA polymerase sigma factor (sigma-70 family)
MSPQTPHQPPSPIPPAERTLTTATGVEILLRSAPLPEPYVTDDEDGGGYPEAPPEPIEPALVFPPNQSTKERDAFVTSLWKEHAGFILDMLRRWQGIMPESRKEVAQEILVTAGNLFMKTGAPENPRAFLVRITRNQASNHRKQWKPTIDREANPAAHLCAAHDPEEEAELAELWEKLERYLGSLSEVEVRLFQARALEGLTFEAIAAELERPCPTVAYQYGAVLRKLQEMAAASMRAADLRAPGPARPGT